MDPLAGAHAAGARWASCPGDGVVDGMLRFHNPSGLPGISQRDALVGQADFARFAAGRGIILPS